ncbi:hypothetical protein D3C71_2029650 [compost metagenome]
MTLTTASPLSMSTGPLPTTIWCVPVWASMWTIPAPVSILLPLPIMSISTVFFTSGTMTMW